MKREDDRRRQREGERRDEVERRAGVDRVEQLGDGGADRAAPSPATRRGVNARAAWRRTRVCVGRVEADHRRLPGGGRRRAGSRRASALSAASGSCAAPAENVSVVEEDRLDVRVARDDVVVDRRRVEHRHLGGGQRAHDRERVLQVARRRAGRSRSGPGSPGRRCWPSAHDDAAGSQLQYGRPDVGRSALHRRARDSRREDRRAGHHHSPPSARLRRHRRVPAAARPGGATCASTRSGHTRPSGRGSGMARDARLGPIAGGTDEVMKEILGKVMGL